jgi:hypothetical protein
MREQPEKSASDESTKAGTSFLVQCNGVRCMAFRDQDGNWRNYFSRELLEGAINIVDENATR